MGTLIVDKPKHVFAVLRFFFGRRCRCPCEHV
jgi:hypothetical protein